MPLDGNGAYTPPSPEFPAVSGETIYAEDFNAIVLDIASTLSSVIYKNGATPYAANQAMGGFKFTGLGAGSAAGDPVNKGQLDAAVPVGSIMAWIGGYFADGSNGTFTNVLGNTIADVNTYLNGKGWYVCDGAALNLSTSAIFNGANRYLPNLTDDRFIMGDTVAGGIGGANSSAHTHDISHTHTIAHTHTLSHYHDIQHVHSIEHTHTFQHYHHVDIGAFWSGATALSIEQMPSHTHTIPAHTGSTGGYNAVDGYLSAASTVTTNATGSGAGHQHTVDPPNTVTSYCIDTVTTSGVSYNSTGAASAVSGGASTATTSGTSTANSGANSAANTGAASASENRPAYLSAFYIMRVI